MYLLITIKIIELRKKIEINNNKKQLKFQKNAKNKMLFRYNLLYFTRKNVQQKKKQCKNVRCI